VTTLPPLHFLHDGFERGLGPVDIHKVVLW